MDSEKHASPQEPDASVKAFYLHALGLLESAEVPFVVGGGYAMAYYTGIIRHTKDLDVFVRPQDRDQALEVFSRAGYRTEITWPHFLGKALTDAAFVDVIYSSANGLCPVDEDFFIHAVEAPVLGRPSRLCPVEEMIWSKAFVQDRDRFDGADVAHLLQAWGHRLDWRRLVGRFRGHERVLLAHLLLFGYIYPSQRAQAPTWVMDELYAKLRSEPPADEPVCRGTFLSHDQYFFDVCKWGYQDARQQPAGPLTAPQIASISPV